MSPGIREHHLSFLRLPLQNTTDGQLKHQKFIFSQSLVSSGASVQVCCCVHLVFLLCVCAALVSLSVSNFLFFEDTSQVGLGWALIA